MTDASINHSETSILTKAQYMKKHQNKTNISNPITDKNETDSIFTHESSILLNQKNYKENYITMHNNHPQIQKPNDINYRQYLTVNDNTINTEIFGILSHDFLNVQSVFTIEEKRDLVVNWIALIHTKYQFEQQTLHLAISIIDRYIRKITDFDIDFQLLAITSFWTASKIEEPKIKQLKAWTKLGKGFDRDQIIQMEANIVSALEYQLAWPTSQVLLWELIKNCTNLSERQIHLCLYILELSLLDCSYNKYQNGILALSIIYLCLKIQGIEDENGNIHNIFLQHWNEVRKCSRKLCKTLQKQQGNTKSPIVRKFASRKLNQVSNISFGRKSNSQISILSAYPPEIDMMKK